MPVWRWQRGGYAAGSGSAPGPLGTRGLRAVAAGEPDPGRRDTAHRRAAVVEGGTARTVLLSAGRLPLPRTCVQQRADLELPNLGGHWPPGRRGLGDRLGAG